MPTKPNVPKVITVHTILKSTMTGDDGTEILYCLPTGCEIFLVELFLHFFAFQSITITSQRNREQRQSYR